MGTRFVLAGCATLLFALGGCSADSGSPASAGKTIDTAPAKTTPVHPPAPEPTREAPDPDGKSDLNCDYVLGDFNESGDPSKGFRFIGGGTVHNSGNVGIVVRVTFTWEMLGQEPLRKHKTYRLRRGATKRVAVTVPGTQDQIDAHQSAHGDCRSKATIVDSFGKPPLE